jgi:hypothetical protein
MNGTTAQCSVCKFVWSDSTCHAHPPSVVIGVMGMAQSSWTWPTVGADDWCGEFQQAAPVAPPTVSTAPTSITPPVVTGAVGQPAICMCTQGVWSPDAIYFTYQWVSGGTDIAGATGNYYQTAASDVGNLVTCRVTASNSYGSTNSVSNAIGPIT